jgi:hypothetical protein
MTEPVITKTNNPWQIDEDDLIRTALVDFTSAFARHIVHDKTPRQALACLDLWRRWLEKTTEGSPS